MAWVPLTSLYENQSKDIFFKGCYIDLSPIPLSLPKKKDWHRQSLRELRGQGRLTRRDKEKEEPSGWYLRGRRERTAYFPQLTFFGPNSPGSATEDKFLGHCGAMTTLSLDSSCGYLPPYVQTHAHFHKPKHLGAGHVDKWPLPHVLGHETGAGNRVYSLPTGLLPSLDPWT